MASKTPILQTEAHSIILLCAVVSFGITIVVLLGGGPHSSINDSFGEALNKTFTLLLFGGFSFIINFTGVVFAGIAASDKKAMRKNKKTIYLVGGFYIFSFILSLVAYTQPI